MGLRRPGKNVERGAAAVAARRYQPARERSLDKLLRIIHALEDCLDFPRLVEHVRSAVRELVRCDGVTLVLRDGDEVYYADEDSIGPLWKGQRFPTKACVSGISILNREQIAIPDIYQDPRVPHEFYRKTFVKSLVMTPVGRRSPAAAIGVYWARRHRATPRELTLLQALADSLSLAMNSIKLRRELETLQLATDTNGLTMASLYQRAEQEVAALRQAEEALRLMDMVVEESPSLVAIIGSDFRYERVNPAHAKLFRLPQERIVGRTMADFLGLSQFNDSLKPYLDRCFAGERLNFECWLLVKNSGRRYFAATCVPLFLAREGGRSIALILRDLTDRKLMEQAVLTKQEELQALADRLLEAREEERQRIARELHDELNQALAAAIIDLEKLAARPPGSPELIRTSIQSIATRLGDLSDSVRSMAHALKPAILEHLGLKAALEAECAEFSLRVGIPARFVFRGGLPDALRSDAQVVLFRVAQECLRNISRHSRAHRASVTLLGSRHEVRLSIRDDGVGFVLPEGKARGIGILNMEEYMRLVGGCLTVESRPGHGTHVKATMPISGDEC